ncbi:MarR family transcriptional regulator [Comamonas sp. BIGb0124]|uniref:MarR family winged helix-turn-helix transcriptional regulator n=1 Tax=Comamonas sp. BIGb0124 TaxID=2485130 RepID=UPI000F4ACB17|nr:MarR family transcriptional regulator [Comamonas sp. BIGb0124]ROR22704.1 MarR family transcriptional regulator [Comamonas sp. BIGb0124]
MASEIDLKFSTLSPSLELENYPGHSIRRLQQIAVAVFMQETEASAVTPVQFAVLRTVADQPGIDQRTLARSVSFDTSTIGGVIDRLEARGLLKRSFSAQDRRVRLLNLTPDGSALLDAVIPPVLQAQDRMLEPLSATERQAFIRLMKKVIAHHEQSGSAADAGSEKD